MPSRHATFGFRNKLILIYLSIILVSILLAGFALQSLHHNLTEDRKTTVRHLVESTWTLLQHYHQLSEQGMGTLEAQQRAKEAVRHMYYGENHYFWISDLDTRLIMHPVQPSLEGKLQQDYQDSRGRYIFRDFAETGRLEGSGFVNYYWPKPDQQQPTEKLSYVKLFEPWGWVIGSGIYMDDIEFIFRKDLISYSLTLTVLLLLIGTLVWNILHYDARTFHANNLMATALEACTEAVLIADQYGQVVWVNTSFEQLSGYMLEEVKGKKPGDLISSGEQPPQFYQQMWSTLACGQPWSGELINRRKNGQRYYEQMTITPVKNRTGYVQNFIAVKKDITDRKLAQQDLEDLASRDSLTGLPNRRVFFEHLQAYLNKPPEYAGMLMMLDLDKFKNVNDTYGHLCGDQVLIVFADVLRQSLRDQDITGRLGGEEFAVLLPGMPLEQGELVAQRLCQRLSETQVQCDANTVIEITVSVGLTPISNSDLTPEMVLSRADQALYLAKRNGRNRIEVVHNQ